MNPHKKLGAVLIEKGYINEAALIRALYEQSQAANCQKPKQGKFDALVATRRLSQRELDLALREAQIQQRTLQAQETRTGCRSQRILWLSIQGVR
ncbi:MAG TPA: hypothetical protein VFS81_20575 [Candidatus Binatia bacterium]|nr:hypothetical protein [Candidatus Binatia bacterium]